MSEEKKQSNIDKESRILLSLCVGFLILSLFTLLYYNHLVEEDNNKTIERNLFLNSTNETINKSAGDYLVICHNGNFDIFKFNKVIVCDTINDRFTLLK